MAAVTAVLLLRYVPETRGSMWYTEYLFLHSLEIHSESDLDSDTFNDLLIVETELETLFHKGIITIEEYVVIRRLTTDGSLNGIMDIADKRTLMLKFSKACAKISFSLGGIFTNEGFIAHLQETHKLTDAQVKRLLHFMQSGHRHDLLKREYKIYAKRSY